MPMRRRKDGLTQFAVHNIKASLLLVRQLLASAIILPLSFTQSILIVAAAFIFSLIMECLTYVKLPLDLINPLNKNRLIESFTDEECYRYFRFRKAQMYELINLLGIRDSYTTVNNLRFPGEYGFCMYVYFLTFPTDLQRMQSLHPL